MPLTVAAIEAELLTLLGPFLDAVGLDATTHDGTNAALRGPIRRAVARLGLTTADPIDVADADLVDLTRTQYERLISLAQLRALEVIWGNWAEVDEKAGEESQSLSQLADRIERWIKALKEELGPLAEDPEAALTPGPAASGLITAGRRMPWSVPPDPRAYPGRPGWDGRYRS